MAMAIRASLGRVVNQSVKTSTGVLVGMQVSRDISQPLCALSGGQFNVQWLCETTDIQRFVPEILGRHRQTHASSSLSKSVGSSSLLRFALTFCSFAWMTLLSRCEVTRACFSARV
jgi:hypothetical protein